MILMWVFCGHVAAAASASPSAGAPAASFDFLMSPPPKKLLPGPVVDRVLEGRAGFDQSPAERPLVGVVEALARIGLGRRVQDARDPEILGVEQPTRFLDEVARGLAR